jgi:septal ring factor EnvC (AmiA/AmiB activator)
MANNVLNKKYILVIVIVSLIIVVILPILVIKLNELADTQNYLYQSQTLLFLANEELKKVNDTLKIKNESLFSVTSDLSDTQEKLDYTKKKLDEIKSKYNESQDALYETNTELYNTKNILYETNNRLDVSENKLKTINTELNNTNVVLGEMQSKYDSIKVNYNRFMNGYGYRLKDPTYKMMQEFIDQDKTDKRTYISGLYDCTNFCADIINNASKQGLRCGYVEIDFPDSAHAIIAFDTTDKGVIYIEPQYDEFVELEVGEHYYQCVVPNPGYYYSKPTFDDTVINFIIIW